MAKKVARKVLARNDDEDHLLACYVEAGALEIAQQVHDEAIEVPGGIEALHASELRHLARVDELVKSQRAAPGAKARAQTARRADEKVRAEVSRRRRLRGHSVNQIAKDMHLHPRRVRRILTEES